MVSYSKVFKSSHVALMPDVKVITNERTFSPPSIENGKSELPSDLQEKQDPIISAAKEEAERILAQAREKASAIQEEAAQKLDAWRAEQEKSLALMAEEANSRGYLEGYEAGVKSAEEKILLDYANLIEEASRIVQKAYQEKKAIISEAEPFLLELSTAIAEQIIGQELDGSPEKWLEMVKRHILRFKEKDSITICVHPEDFDFIQEERNHLKELVNGDTEIKIIPDHTVTPKGCVIRTEFGSVDARIDTQIEHIRQAILEAGREPEHEHTADSQPLFKSNQKH